MRENDRVIRHQGGKDQIDPTPAGHDDLANAAAGVLLSAAQAGPRNFNRVIEYPKAAVA